MAEITFVGAAGTVTGSKHLVTVGGKRFFVDCGLFQGTAEVRALNDAKLPVDAEEIDAVVITHGHLDHTGYLPKLVKDGFDGQIYCTPATAAIAEIVLEDAAHLQQELAERGHGHERPHAPPPFYDDRDVARTLRKIETVEYERVFSVAGICNARYSNAGHILGSAFVHLTIEGKQVVFSGDLGRYDRPLLADPSPIGEADIICCESTYGDRDHPAESISALGDALRAGIARGGAIVIPAFAVERTQDILYAIARLQQQDPAIANLAIHLDSPMAEKVDAIFERFGGEHRAVAGDSPSTPFGIHHFTEHRTTDESKALNAMPGNYVVISASGMASGGRILHHLHNHLADPRATIVLCGYQSVGTLGNLLEHGAKTIRIYGDAIPVRAAIVALKGFSAHADRTALVRWLHTCTGSPRFYAVHGEAASAAALAAEVRQEIKWSAQVATRGTTVTL